MQVFSKKMQKNLHMSEKSSTFAPAFDRERLSIEKNGVLPLLKKCQMRPAQWCNGSTTDSGSVCLGSSPG